MFELAKSSAILFFQGKLFKNNTEVIRQLAMGIALTVIVFLVLAKFAGLIIAAVVSGFIGGAVQPVLFKDLKYR